MSAGGIAVRAIAVSKVFGHGRARACAVRDVTLEARSGELTVILGPSGSGKTTLLSLLGGLLPPSSGEIQILERSTAHLTNWQLTRLRLRSIGFVFQTFHLIEALSAVENVELALNLAKVARPESSQRARQLLTELGLGDRLESAAGTLSGGEKQRVALARALANNPALILADEPTGSLDSKVGQHVIGLLHGAAHGRGKAVVVTSHDPAIRSLADRLFTMEDGMLHPAGGAS